MVEESKLSEWIEKKKREYMDLFMDGKEKQEINHLNRHHMSRWLLLDELRKEIDKGTFKA